MGDKTWEIVLTKQLRMDGLAFGAKVVDPWKSLVKLEGLLTQEASCKNNKGHFDRILHQSSSW